MIKKPSPFAQRVYELISTIPRGKVSTYKYVAQALNTKAYQAVGQALRCNPFAPKVPCHRVIASDGSLGGFAGKKTGERIREKISLLKKEDVLVSDNKVINFKQKLWKF